jgi:hypothetical protein
MSTLAQKQQDFHAFFMLQSEVKINLNWQNTSQSPSLDELEVRMPEGFRLLNAASEIQQTALKPIPSLGKAGEQLVAFLQLQAKKLDLLLANMLQQEDNPAQRFFTDAFGGAGCRVLLSEQVDLERLAEVKIFIEEEAIAVYCFAEVVDVVAVSDTQFMTSLLFSTIREVDQEALVRATMHMQTAQLKQRQQHPSA